MRESERAAFEELEAWSRAGAAERPSGLHPAVEVYHDPTTGFSLRVKQDAAQGVSNPCTVATCASRNTLSYLNALVGGPFPPETAAETRAAFPTRFMDTVPPHVIGRFFFIKEYLLGEDSHWWPYIRTLPQPDRIASWALPAFWPEEDAAFLVGTNANVAIQEIQANVKSEFKLARKLLKADGVVGWQDYTRVLYNWAFCIFTSRSFRPSLVLSAENRSDACRLLPQACDLDDFSLLQPLFDVANHSPTAGIAWDTATDPQACHLVCQGDYKAGQQVYNNYGQKTNSELLLGYGFILPASAEFHNDYIHLRKREDQQLAGDTAGSEAAEGRGRAKLRDYLVSLRPMNDSSSMAGRARQLVQDPSPQRLAQFAHFEDAMVWDMATLLMTEEERAAIEKELQNLAARIREVLSAKLQYELDKLRAAVDFDGRPRGVGLESGEHEGTSTNIVLSEPTNRNQELALAYRQRCLLVLDGAIRSLSLKAPTLP
ncbi:SET domain-containing protein [Thozetella sp. PMI_491]|nr:SET domain-containing protein [Thozetella sp. PMI_491]